MKECSLKELRQLSEEILKERKKYGIKHTPDSCVGKCIYVENAITEFLKKNGCNAEFLAVGWFIGDMSKVHPLWKKYRRISFNHNVTLAGDFIIDFTASQFNPEHSPYRIVHASEFLKDWFSLTTSSVKWKKYKDNRRKKDVNKLKKLDEL